MMKAKALIILFTAFFSLLSIVIGCKKKDNTQESPSAVPTSRDNETTTLYRYIMVHNISNDITNMGLQIFENGDLTSFKTSGQQNSLGSFCYTITNSAKIYTVDFGTTPCIELDGVARRGKLIFDCSNSSYSATSSRMPGFSFKVTALDYKVFGTPITINYKVIANVTPLSVTGQTVYSGTDIAWKDSSSVYVELNNSINRTSFDGLLSVTLANSNDTSCYKGQMNSINWNKAYIRISGNVKGSTKINPDYLQSYPEPYTALLTNVSRSFTCEPEPNSHDHPYISGNVIFVPGNRATRYFDYGSGLCDRIQMVTINGEGQILYF
jgi:hypothetical protein